MEEEISRYIQHVFFDRKDILFTDVRILKYANVIFDHEIYNNVRIVKNFLRENGVEPIGRFGEWDYFWTDQLLLSGKDIVDK